MSLLSDVWGHHMKLKHMMPADQHQFQRALLSDIRGHVMQMLSLPQEAADDGLQPFTLHPPLPGPV